MPFHKFDKSVGSHSVCIVAVNLGLHFLDLTDFDEPDFFVEIPTA